MELFIFSHILPDRFPENFVILDLIIVCQCIALPMMNGIRDKDGIAMKCKDSRFRGLVFSAAAPAMVQEERLSLISDRVHDADGNIPHVTFLDMEL